MKAFVALVCLIASVVTVYAQGKITCTVPRMANARSCTTEGSTVNSGSTVTYTCNTGYTSKGGDARRLCVKLNTWSGTNVRCEHIRCAVPSLANAKSSTTEGSTVKYGSTVTYTCNTGYTLKGGDQRRRCVEENTWSGTNVRCEPAACPQIRATNGRLSTPATTHGIVVQMTCNDKYRRVNGDYTVKCYNGKWSGTPLYCRRGYGFQEPPVPAASKNCVGFCQGNGDRVLVPAGDVNGDGYADIICHKQDGRINIAVNDQNGGFTCSGQASGIESGWCKGNKQYVFVADFNGDKKVDVICHRYDTGVKDIRLVRNSNSYWNPTNEGFSGWCTHNRAEFHVADFDGDGKADMLCHDNRTGYKWLAKGRSPSMSFLKGQYTAMAWCFHGTAKLYVADANGDGSYDIYCHDDHGNVYIRRTVRINSKSNNRWTVHWKYPNPQQQPKEMSTFCKGNTKAHMPKFHLMDFNGDGAHDLYCHKTAASESNCVILGRAGSFSDRDQCKWQSTKNYCNSKNDLLIFGKFYGTKRDDILCIRQKRYYLVRNYGV